MRPWLIVSMMLCLESVRGYFIHSRIPIRRIYSSGHEEIGDLESIEESIADVQRSIKEPTYDDMKELAIMLANVTDHLESQPEIALSIAAQSMGWLYSRNVTHLTQMMLNEFPSLRQDEGLMRSYMFIMDFLEAVAKETSSMLKTHRTHLKSILEAAKQSEEAVNARIASLKEDIKSPDFMVYLDAEIEGQDSNSPMENLLVTIKLRVLDEIGRDMGVDVVQLPILAAEEDPAELRRKTVLHLSNYDKAGIELFLQVLGMMRMEMKKRYKAVDPILFMNLGEIEKIAKGLIQ